MSIKTIGAIINSSNVGLLPYNGTLYLNRELNGAYFNAYSHVGNGAIPICYAGVNALVATDGVTTVVGTFPDLLTAQPADIISWLNDGFVAIATLLGFGLISVLQNGNGDYVVTLAGTSFTLQLSNVNSSISAILGKTDMISTFVGGINYQIIISATLFDDRPKFIGLQIAEANSIYATATATNISLVMSTKDEVFRGGVVYFADDISALTLTIVRLNAPNVACPMLVPYYICLQKSLTGTFN